MSRMACCRADAVSRIASSNLKELVLTDTIRATEAVRVAKNIRVMSIAPLIGEAIARISQEQSVSSLFENAAVAGVYAAPVASADAAPETGDRAGPAAGGRGRLIPRQLRGASRLTGFSRSSAPATA